MIVVTKESLIRGNFSLSTPIKCSCGMLHPRNKPRADWLAQRGGCHDRRGACSIPRGLKFFSWDCMALCGAVAGPCCLGFSWDCMRSRFRCGARWTFCRSLFSRFLLAGCFHARVFAGSFWRRSLFSAWTMIGPVYLYARPDCNTNKTPAQMAFDLNVPVLDLNEPLLEDIGKFASFLASLLSCFLASLLPCFSIGK